MAATLLRVVLLSVVALLPHSTKCKVLPINVRCMYILIRPTEPYIHALSIAAHIALRQCTYFIERSKRAAVCE